MKYLAYLGAVMVISAVSGFIVGLVDGYWGRDIDNISTHAAGIVSGISFARIVLEWRKP